MGSLPSPRPVPDWGVGDTWGVTLGSAPFSSTSSGALVVPVQGSPSSRHRQQKRDWRMLRLRGFLAGVWVPGKGQKGRVRGQVCPGESPPPRHSWGVQGGEARYRKCWGVPCSPPHPYQPPHPSGRPSCPAKRQCRDSARDRRGRGGSGGHTQPPCPGVPPSRGGPLAWLKMLKQRGLCPCGGRGRCGNSRAR